MLAYRFDGYWKDVGTLESLWNANMDMLNPESGLNLIDDSWPVYAQTFAAPAAFLGPWSEVSNAAFNRGDIIDGCVNNSVLSQNITIEEGAVVDHSVLFPGVKVEKDAVIRHAIIGEGCVIGCGAHIGEEPGTGENDESGITVLGPDCIIEEGRVIKANRMLDSDGREVAR